MGMGSARAPKATHPHPSPPFEGEGNLTISADVHLDFVLEMKSIGT